MNGAREPNAIMHATNLFAACIVWQSCPAISHRKDVFLRLLRVSKDNGVVFPEFDPIDDALQNLHMFVVRLECPLLRGGSLNV